jgi:hypothetical protein
MNFKNLGDPPLRFDRALKAMDELRLMIPSDGLTFLNEIEKYCTSANGERIFIGDVKNHEMASFVTVKATAYNWIFKRKWTYWVCQADPGHGIPEDVARELNKTWIYQVRVDGVDGGTDVTGPVDLYHIDTFEGFRAFVGEICNRPGLIRPKKAVVSSLESILIESVRGLLEQGMPRSGILELIENSNLDVDYHE